jgi:RNA polymerase sigma factor (sigma-70 family)
MPQDEAERHDLVGLLLAAIATLPDRRQRMVVLWGYLAELDDDEIAQRLGITRNYVHQLRHRALTNLRKDPALLAQLRSYLGID